ncbi:hypothetical protein [Burkholderia anthina]|uniref:hypothetical protein n=1 Tax=Burkholderia anthina TaxID=179879 RepID=UPI00158ACA51|nr:hypothetical protein [Burkholderia anthina]
MAAADERANRGGCKPVCSMSRRFVREASDVLAASMPIRSNPFEGPRQRNFIEMISGPGSRINETDPDASGKYLNLIGQV